MTEPSAFSLFKSVKLSALFPFLPLETLQTDFHSHCLIVTSYFFSFHWDSSSIKIHFDKKKCTTSKKNTTFDKYPNLSKKDLFETKIYDQHRKNQYDL